jgi:hypothetical protein
MAVEVKTDRKWKQFRYRDEVPESVLEDQFDYLDEDEAFDGFFQYHGHWYHLSDFMRIPPGFGLPYEEWDGYASDSYFSGVLIKVSSDGEEYMVGTYIS